MHLVGKILIKEDDGSQTERKLFRNIDNSIKSRPTDKKANWGGKYGSVINFQKVNEAKDS